MKKIAVIGLGYVGLPLAVEFGKKRQTIGFDINEMRVKEFKTYVGLSGALTKLHYITQQFKFSNPNNIAMSDTIRKIKMSDLFDD